MNGFVKSCALALAACLLAGCAPSLPPQPTLDELLAEVNAEHQAVHQPRVDESQYLREAPDEESVARADRFNRKMDGIFSRDVCRSGAQCGKCSFHWRKYLWCTGDIGRNEFTAA